MAGGNVPSGTSTFTGTIGVAGTAETTFFADSYNYVLIQNTGTVPLWVTADGSTPSASGVGSGVAIPGGTQILLANGRVLWFQSQKVITAGTAQLPRGGGAATVSPSMALQTSPGMPGEEVPFMSSGYGQVPNPGTTVKVVTASGATPLPTYTISGAG